MSIKLELDNGKLKQYATLMTDYGLEGYSPEKPYHTKCGLSFKEYPKDGACDHIECAIEAARWKSTYPIMMYCIFSIMIIAVSWHEKGDLLAGIQDSEGFLMLGPLLMLMSISPFMSWLELREYKDHGTIHGQKAKRLFLKDEIILRLQMNNGEIKEYQTAYKVGCNSSKCNCFDYSKWAYEYRIKWPKEPCQECAALECAIYKAGKKLRRYEVQKLFITAIVLIFLPVLAISQHRLIPLIVVVLFVFALIVLIGFGQKYKDYLNELKEFKNNGTINGIVARQISEEPYARQTFN